MNATLWSRVQEIVSAAAEMEPATRRAWVESTCGGDTALREQVEDMLAAYSQAGDFFEQAIQHAATRAALLQEFGLGDRLGPYEITEVLGHGGMGTVYRARRADDQFKQDVAIKAVRSALGASEQLFLRFRAERQILANINHPNIARLLDGGVSDAGMPFLVMEFIEGRTLDRFVEEAKPTLSVRLALFRQLCGAIQSAHQNLVVHRDLKPANVMVTADGTPKLLDFGIAKLLIEEPGEKTVFLTRPVERVLTPEYASPEQLRGGTITTAADVYGLGVVLYELVAGKRPFHLQGLSAAEVERVVCDTQPARPSHAGALQPQGRWRRRATDLDRIVLKAMHKQPNRRYPSAADLSDDVQRYLDGFPVTARPDSVRYRTNRFVARHPVALATSALALLAVIGLSIGLAVQAQRAKREASSAEAVSQYLVGLFQNVQPDATQGRSISARDLLDQGTAKLNSSWRGQPGVKARLLGTLGTVYFLLGATDRAEALLSQAETLYSSHPPPDPIEAADAEEYLAITLIDRGDFDRARSIYNRILPVYERYRGHNSGDTADALDGLGVVSAELGDFAAAERYYREAMAINSLVLGPEARGTLADQHNLQSIYSQIGDYKSAERMIRKTLAIRRRTTGDNRTATAAELNNLGYLLEKTGRFAEAEPVIQETLALRHHLFGAEHPHIAMSLVMLGTQRREQGRLAEARELTEQGLAMEIKTEGDHSRDTAFDMDALGMVYLAAGEPERARPLMEKALRLRLANSHPPPLFVSESYDHLGLLELSEGHLPSARADVEKALQLQRTALPAENDAVAASYNTLGQVLLAGGDVNGAQQSFAHALRLARAAFGDRPHPITANALAGLGSCLRGKLPASESEQYLEGARRMRQSFAPTASAEGVAAARSASLVH